MMDEATRLRIRCARKLSALEEEASGAEPRPDVLYRLGKACYNYARVQDDRARRVWHAHEAMRVLRAYLASAENIPQQRVAKISILLPAAEALSR